MPVTIHTPSAPTSPLLALLGGAGPVATLRVHEAILAYAGTLRGPVRDHEFPPLLVWNQAWPDVDEWGAPATPLVARTMAHRLDLLKTMGASAALVSCVSLHGVLKATPVLPILPWVEHGIRTLIHNAGPRIMPCVSRAIRDQRGFWLQCKQWGATPVLMPRAIQSHVDALILLALRQAPPAAAAAHWEVLDNWACAHHVRGLWLGCTDLLHWGVPPISLPVMPPLDAMVDAVGMWWGFPSRLRTRTWRTHAVHHDFWRAP